MPSLRVAFKALTQLGFEPLALYALYQLGLRTGHYRRLESRALQEQLGSSVLRPLMALPQSRDLLEVMDEQSKAALLHEADEIAEGKVRLFGGEPVPLKLAFDGPLQHWTTYETGKASIPFSGYPVRDIKFVWEPARFGWALTLGRAYRVSGKEEYAEAFWRFFEQFHAGNPAYMGPHWMNGQEVAIRLMSLLWAAQLFETSAASTAERIACLLDTIAEHARRIPPTLVYARSQNNNHLVTEAAALFAAGTALARSDWRAQGWFWLNHALQRQISSYGEYIQHSTNYHRVMLQSVLWVDAILRGGGEHWPFASMQAITRASHWLFSMIDPVSGEAPNLGANDGSLILPLNSAAFEDFRPTVQAAARAFLRTSLPPGPWDELSLWLGLRASDRTADSNAYMAEHLRGKNSWAYLRASRFPSRLSHMDQLHFDLWWRGQNVVPDAGSYLYNAEPPWDNPLVSTRVHNTITIDGQDQMQRGGRFLALDWFPAYSKSVLESDERILGRMVAYHKGYRRLGVRHERVATVYSDEHWTIEDRLIFIRPGEHVFRLHWLLTDGEWKLETREARIEMRVKLQDGTWMILRVKPDARISLSDVRTSLVCGGDLMRGREAALPFEGWVSPRYGLKMPALSLVVEVTSVKSTSFVSEFRFEQA
ncbi:MAG TPA: alginate lyase family protein [Anaerolineales bacterium]